MDTEVALSSLDERPLPTPALVGAGLLVLTTIVGVGAIQLTKHFAPPHQATATETAIDTRDLRFVDQGDGVNAYGGHVRVYDAVTGNELPPLRESDGFIRAVLNSLNFERTKRNMDAPPVFQLIRWSGDKITLEDRATGARVNIGAFGNGNRAVFLRFFEQARETP
jgi:putative photosynthetic complex assembly protein